ncbi:TetR/AcrR family transcriptional regulator [Dictyobacter kobayashii]|uniref:TetR/AcrR family transcriptional regulator n=1 Tax=Dictyobacter kobayashii TaxID=2014872 RepID=UPI0010A97412|nr:TetR/AcrR family transcriptional regulator [Dictyobacter kobayashii]
MVKNLMIFDQESANVDKRHTERDPETQRRILAVAERLFLAKGFKGVSMKDIADEVQVTAAALYYYFPRGKQELFMSMVQQYVQNWTQQTFESISQIEGTRAKLVKLAEAFFSRQFSNFFALVRDIEEFCRDKPVKESCLKEIVRTVNNCRIFFSRVLTMESLERMYRRKHICLCSRGL